MSRYSVHRYKNQAVRLNVAHAHGAALFDREEAPKDPWALLFDAACQAAASETDLSPWWIFDGPAKIERRVLVPPLSREAARLPQLRRSVAVYRLAFGQPRQDDLLEWLRNLVETCEPGELAQLQISLKPRSTAHSADNPVRDVSPRWNG